MTQQPMDPRDSGLFDLEAIANARSETFPPRWVEIARPRPEAPRRRGRAWALPLASLLTAISAVAFAWAPAFPVEPMHIAVSTEHAPPVAAEVPVHVVPAATMTAEPPVPEARARRRSRRARLRGAPAARPVVEASTAGPSHAARSWATGSEATSAPLDRSIDSLLDEAVGAPSEPHPTQTMTLPTTPTRRQVSTTLRALEGEVRQCGEGAVTVRLTVAGRTGRVSQSSVQGAGNTVVARCVADVVESARFPRFSQERFVVVFPYRM